MNLRLLKNIKTITLTGLKNNQITVHPAMIVSVKQENYASLISLADGESLRVQESPEQISAVIAGNYTYLTRRAYAYSHIIESEECGENPFTDEDDDRYYRVEALKNMAFSNKRSTLPRLMSIYRQILSPFTFFKAASGDYEKMSNYRKDMEDIIEDIKLKKQNTKNRKD